VDHKLAQGTDRRRWILLGTLVIVALLCLIPLLPGAAVQTTTVYVVRHAEKADNTVNPPRAQELARVLGDDEIDAIFVTSFIRTQQTGAPVAAANGIQVEQYPAGNAQSVVDTILADHVGDRVLVVGHSNTVDDIAAGLGAGGLSDLGEDQFDRLFVIHRLGNVTHLDRLRFGAEAP
jgi:broad specificity phosphatase PhoE